MIYFISACGQVIRLALAFKHKVMGLNPSSQKGHSVVIANAMNFLIHEERIIRINPVDHLPCIALSRIYINLYL